MLNAYAAAVQWLCSGCQNRQNQNTQDLEGRAEDIDAPTDHVKCLIYADVQGGEKG